jgi:hypothetical protein
MISTDFTPGNADSAFLMPFIQPPHLMFSTKISKVSIRSLFDVRKDTYRE